MCLVIVTKERGGSQYWKLQQIYLEVGCSKISRDESDLLVEGQKDFFVCFPWHLRTQLAEEMGKRLEAKVIKSHCKHVQKSKGIDSEFGKVSILLIFSDITWEKENLISIFLLIIDFYNEYRNIFFSTLNRVVL